MPFTVGLTGGIGSGKSTVGREFEVLNVVVIDADAIAHEMTTPGGAAIQAIRDSFGPNFVGSDGALDRAVMRAHVFANPAERQRLEGILHPLIRAETERRARAATSAYHILMIPLLVEAKERDQRWRARFDRILVVDCAETTQIKRVMARNAFSESAVRSILAAQASRMARLDAADDVIDNDDESLPLAPRVLTLHQRYLALAQG